MKNRTVYLIRGHSGSGKSTLARKLALAGGVHLENDQFLLDKEGIYRIANVGVDNFKSVVVPLDLLISTLQNYPPLPRME